MDFVLATNNMKKLAEMQRILAPLGVNIVTAKSLGTELPEVEETGVTFAENAELKAQSACDITGLPAIADDSGLCVDYLNGAPGVYSARFAGEHGNDEKNNDLLLEKLEGVLNEDDYLLQEILFNPYTSGQVAQIREELAELIDIIDHKDAKRMKLFLTKIRNHVKEDIEIKEK